LRTQVFKSAAYGERKNYRFDMTGRIVIDLLQHVRREFKLRSYKLDDVAFHFLKDRKIDLKAKLMFKYWEESPQRRAEIAEYCMKDCDLPITLLYHTKISALPNLIEMSRVTYTPLTQILERGQQIKVFNQLVWFGHEMNFVMNDLPRGGLPKKFVGAVVVDPKPGWYDFPIATLDFASLYPSIMRNKNLCYATYITNPDYFNVLPENCYHRIRIGRKVHNFVKKKVLKGVLPTLEEHLLSARKVAKKQMKAAKSPDKYAMLNGKQLALKISCNSVFGFTGAAARGMYPCPAIAESITATGREMIERTKATIMKRYPGSDVIYGDTDSVMVKFDVTADEKGLYESFRLGDEAAAYATEMFGDAIELEMEKVYFPYLLFGKKRYAGLMYEEPAKYSYIDNKGIETVRRDWSGLTGEVMLALLDKIFLERDIEGSKQYVVNTMQKMIDNEIPIEKFVMSKSLKSTYKNPDGQPHVRVVRKIAERNPGSEPTVGDRVPFVIVRVKQKKPKFCEQAEDPRYVTAHPKKAQLDYIYYIDKQLKKPLHKLFDPFMDDPEDLFVGIRRQIKNQYDGFGRGGLMAYLNKAPTSGPSSSPYPSPSPSPPPADDDMDMDRMFPEFHTLTESKTPVQLAGTPVSKKRKRGGGGGSKSAQTTKTAPKPKRKRTTKGTSKNPPKPKSKYAKPEIPPCNSLLNFLN
jgi:DNA polymerase delta subunit 1